jgi:shikimate kinase
MLTVLLGPKHSGKTAVGRELAALLEMPFFDTDELIEAETGKSVRALYTAGQNVFRRHEAAALFALLNKQYGVIATGGGIIDNDDAM